MVRVYQPMAGLNRPVVVDTGVANFKDVRLTVYCVPGDLVKASEARVLCRRMATVFENQGAQVTTYTRDRRELADQGDDPLGGAGGDADAPPPTDLTLELRSRSIHEARDPLSWVFCIYSATVLPAVSESTFAIDVVIRDESGFLLVSDSLQGRLVERFGIGTWAGNKLLDWVWRDEADEITGDAANRDLSADVYQQLSQLMFNAKMQWEVLQEATPAGPGL